jgi:hypothetical protein
MLHPLKLAGLFLFSSHSAFAAYTFAVQLVADNDFAVYAGTATTITRLIYQNPVDWPSQIDFAASATIELEEGESFLYVLAMGGGGEENLSGRINGVNIVGVYLDNSAAVRMSSPVQSFLTEYDLGQVEAGSYSPLLADVQAAMNSGLLWGDPSVGDQTVISNNPYAELEGGVRSGFMFDDSEAVLFRFGAESLDIRVVPEPATAMLAALACLGFVSRRRL